MEKLPMCRICLADNGPMYVVVNRNLLELYEKLTNIPFVAKDRKPILACSFCCTKLKKAFRLMRQCLVAEELLAQMMDEHYEPKSIINFRNGFIITPVEQINIVDRCQTESIAIKQEFPADCEGLEDIKEDQSDEYIEPESVDVKPMLLQHSESDSEDYVPIIDFKIGVEEAVEEPKTKPRAVETNSTRVTRKTKLEDTTQLKKYEQSKLLSQTTHNRTPEPRSLSEVKQRNADRFKCHVCQRICTDNSSLAKHVRTHTGEKPHKCNMCQRSFTQKCHLNEHMRIHTGLKPFECHICQRSFTRKGHLKSHVRTHTDFKPYECNVCQKTFREKGNLTIHFRKHTGEKPYSCDVCQRSFKEKGALNKHKSKHNSVYLRYLGIVGKPG